MHLNPARVVRNVRPRTNVHSVRGWQLHATVLSRLQPGVVGRLPTRRACTVQPQLVTSVLRRPSARHARLLELPVNVPPSMRLACAAGLMLPGAPTARVPHVKSAAHRANAPRARLLRLPANALLLMQPAAVDGRTVPRVTGHARMATIPIAMSAQHNLSVLQMWRATLPKPLAIALTHRATTCYTPVVGQTLPAHVSWEEAQAVKSALLSRCALHALMSKMHVHVRE